MNKKAQILIVSLWILVILTLLAVSLGHRVSMALRFSRYQKDRLKALVLAKAGINRAIVELQKDKNDYDALNELWADNEWLFKRIALDDNQSEFATVKYNIVDKNNQQQVIYGVMDEEKKININAADQSLLETLLESYGDTIVDKVALAYNIRAWRGDQDALIPDEAKNYRDLGYACKCKKFANIEEITLVKGITPEIYKKISDLITIYGAGKVNINTAAKGVVEILINTCVRKLQERGVRVENPKGLLTSIMTFRERENGFFRDINLDSKPEGLSNYQKNIINDSIDGLKNKICVQSHFFRIIAEGNISYFNLKRRINCVFNRATEKIVFWHEN